MRLALLGWEIDEQVVRALVESGAEVVAFTPSAGERRPDEDRAGWTSVPCLFPGSGGSGAEGEKARDDLLERAGRLGPFDVVHALDPMTRWAADAVADRSPGCVRVATLTLADVSPGLEPGATCAADRWVAEHPWIADRWLARRAGELRNPTVVPTQTLLDRPSSHTSGPQSRSERTGPLMVIWLPRIADIDAAGVARALAAVAAEAPAFSSIVLGSGPQAHALRTRLTERRVLARPASEVVDPSPGDWTAWLSAASVVGLASTDLADDPAAWIAWSFGAPVVRLNTANPRALGDAVRACFPGHGQPARIARAGAAWARRRLSAAGVAAGLLRVYLDALNPPAASEHSPEPDTVATLGGLLLGGRTRVMLVAIGTREAYAAWHVRPDDRASALEWLGPSAVYASLALRLYDVTDIIFDGTNANGVWDIDLGLREQFRTIALEGPGRSLAVSLGLRTPRGHFHPLAHAGPAHLPRESDATFAPNRWLRAIPRR